MVSVFEEEKQFAEDLGQVRPVDLIYDQNECFLGVGGGLFGQPFEGPVLEFERAVFSGPPAFDEVLIGVGGVELDELDPVLGPGKPVGEFERYPGLSRSGRPVEDGLRPVAEQLDDLLECGCRF